MMASVLLTQMPFDNHDLRNEAVHLVFKIDGEIRRVFEPKSVEFESIEIQEVEMVMMKLDFYYDLSPLRGMLQGANLLELSLTVDSSKITTEGGAEFTYAIKDNPHERNVIVEFPEDIMAKREALSRHKGNAIRDSLIRTIEEMQKMERMGHNYPTFLKEQLLLAAETDWHSATDSDHEHA